MAGHPAKLLDAGYQTEWPENRQSSFIYQPVSGVGLLVELLRVPTARFVVPGPGPSRLFLLVPVATARPLAVTVLFLLRAGGG